MARNAVRNAASEESLSSVWKGPRCWDHLDQVSPEWTLPRQPQRQRLSQSWLRHQHYQHFSQTEGCVAARRSTRTPLTCTTSLARTPGQQRSGTGEERFAWVCLVMEIREYARDVGSAPDRWDLICNFFSLPPLKDCQGMKQNQFSGNWVSHSLILVSITKQPEQLSANNTKTLYLPQALRHELQVEHTAVTIVCYNWGTEVGGRFSK